MSGSGNPAPASNPVGVAKIVKLGEDTILVIELTEAEDLAEGEVKIEAITALLTGPSGATVCGVQITTSG